MEAIDGILGPMDLLTFRQRSAVVVPEWTEPRDAIDALIELDGLRDDLPVAWGAKGMGIREYTARWAEYYLRRAAVLCRCADLWPSPTVAAAAQAAAEDWADAARKADVDDPSATAQG